MKLSDHAQRAPQRPALIDGSGESHSFAQLEARSAALARLLIGLGLREGDGIALVGRNTFETLAICWAAHRSGLHYTPINWHLTSREAAYIANDCGAKVFIAAAALAELARGVRTLLRESVPCYSMEGLIDGFSSIDDAAAKTVDQTLRDMQAGSPLFYSSGTTGVPKGIKRQLDLNYNDPLMLEPLMTGLYGFTSDSIYLCPAPLYHAAPLGWSMAAQKLGATVVLMEQFDPEQMLACIEKYRVTHVQCVPTMFVRLLALPAKVRARYDVSSLRAVIHAAAPCPVPVKEQMIAWWGPIVHEYYAGSEGIGYVAISSPEWLAHKGSVGRALVGIVHIVGDAGQELPRGEAGTIYFENAKTKILYHNDPEKTRAAQLSNGWGTMGDIGYLDTDGYLFLLDRRTDLILSGGVNVYPREAEDVLITHPAVADVAVIGVPAAEFGEEVKAVVELRDGITANAALGAELVAYCRDRLAHFKCPRSVDFAQLPRTPTGKLLRRVIRERYRAAAAATALGTMGSSGTGSA